MQATAPIAASPTGLLVPRLHADVPLRFDDGFDGAVLTKLMELGHLKPSDLGAGVADHVGIAIDRASGGLAEGMTQARVHRDREKETLLLGISIWPNESRLLLGSFIQYIGENASIAAAVQAANYIAGILNSHPYIAGPEAYADFISDTENLLSEDCAGAPSPLACSKVVFDRKYTPDKEAHDTIRAVHEELANILDVLIAGATTDSEFLEAFVDQMNGNQCYILTGWSGEETLVDHSIDALIEAQHDGGECYETVSASIPFEQLSDLRKLFEHIHFIEKLIELSWTLKSTENHSFLSRLSSATVDHPGQLLLNILSSPESSSQTASPSISKPSSSP